jgi:ATP-dependent Clp protease protease subunit
MAEKHVWIRFMTFVNQNTTASLFSCIDEATKNKCTHLHLLIFSSGGSVFYGVSIYNYLKGTNMNITTYNFGLVESAAVILFCAGKKRICVPNSAFLIHPITLQPESQSTVLREKDLDEMAKNIKINTEIYARIVSDTTNQSVDKVKEDMTKSTILDPKDSKKYGLATDIESELYKGDELYSIYETGQIFHYVPTSTATQNGSVA